MENEQQDKDRQLTIRVLPDVKSIERVKKVFSMQDTSHATVCPLVLDRAILDQAFGHFLETGRRCTQVGSAAGNGSRPGLGR